MKRLGRIIGNALAVALTVFSMQTVAVTQPGGSDFNHMLTGFPLSGMHATTACDTCHIGGVFKGTPKNCEGCHALSARIVATPKPNDHIVTDAPCETCHFNTSTFLGARFNHGTARPGQCSNCHNGRITTGKPVNHTVTVYSCDQCHRSSSWIPASWNHTGVTGDCSSCHRATGPGRNFNPATHMSQAVMTSMGLTNCNGCHKNYYSFYGAVYDHVGAAPTCGTCHNAGYVGVKQITSTAAHVAYTSSGITLCQSCHKSYTSFVGALYDHAGASPACGNCHNNAAYGAGIKQIVSTAAHAVYTGVGLTNCQSCHKSYSTFVGSRYDHVGAGLCATCHTAANSPTIQAMAPNHIPILVTAICTACHTSTANWATETMSHTPTQVALTPCKTCHLSTAVYLGRMTKKGYGHQGFSVSQDCISCHSQSYSRWNNP